MFLFFLFFSRWCFFAQLAHPFVLRILQFYLLLFELVHFLLLRFGKLGEAGNFRFEVFVVFVVVFVFVNVEIVVEIVVELHEFLERNILRCVIILAGGGRASRRGRRSHTRSCPRSHRSSFIFNPDFQPTESFTFIVRSIVFFPIWFWCWRFNRQAGQTVRTKGENVLVRLSSFVAGDTAGAAALRLSFSR